jgi:VCBS repeat-containing protein
VEDEHGLKDRGVLNITITGTNDAPVVLATSNLTGEVTEPTGNTFPQVSGTIHADDDSGFFTFRPPYVTTNEYGLFTLNPFNGKWTFILGDGPAVQALNDGDHTETKFTVTIRDFHGLETTADVVITIHGTDELFTGTDYDDILNGTPYVDDITGGAGDDIIYAGSGNDTVYGGAGDDTIYAGSGDDIVYGSMGDDHIEGGSGDDFIYGGNGDDTLLGGSGNDVISGDDGNDILIGGSGDDILWGGKGRDTLTGGDGEDIFVFTNVEDSSRTGKRDTITDFESGKDKIDLSHFDANGDAPGDARFIFTGLGTADRTQDSGYLKYFHEDGKTILIGGVDDNSDGMGDFILVLDGIRNLTANDFVTGSVSTIDPNVGTGADETFYSNAGRDVFHGGGGSDIFVISDPDQSRYANNWDVITDWEADDKIDLSGMGLNVTALTYATNSNSNVQPDKLKVFQIGNDTFITGDVDSDKAADFKIQLSNVDMHDITLDHFILI